MRPSELSHGRRWRNGLGGGRAGDARRFAAPADPANRWRNSPYPLTIAVWVICILVTAALLWSPYLPFGFPNRSLHLVLDSVDACIALLVAYLLHNRFLRGWRLQDWLLTEAMVPLAFAGLGLTFLLEEVLGVRDGRLNVWLPWSCARAVRSRAGRRAERGADRPAVAPAMDTGRSALFITLCAIASWVWRDALPVALEQPPADAVTPMIAGHPVLLASQSLGAACFLVASLSFARQAARRDDELLRWLAPAFTLAAFARVHYLSPVDLHRLALHGDLLRTRLLPPAAPRRDAASCSTTGARTPQRGAGGPAPTGPRAARRAPAGLAYIRIETNGIPADVASKRHIADATERALDEARGGERARASATVPRVRAAPHGAGARGAACRRPRGRSRRLHPGRPRPAARPHADHARGGAEWRAAWRCAPRAHPAGTHRRGSPTHGRRRRVGFRLGVGVVGVGAASAATPARPATGSSSMDDRARGLPGELQIASSPGEGCLVTVTW